MKRTITTVLGVCAIGLAGFALAISHAMASGNSESDSLSAVTVWMRIAEDGHPFTVTGEQLVRYGDGGILWAATKTMSGTGSCTKEFFGSDPSPWQPKFCEVRKTVPGVVQIPGAMPVVNRALIPEPEQGYDGPRVRTLTAGELVPGSVWHPVAADIGAFRVPCGSFAHVSNDDPIVFPGKPGASHLHTFVGNTAANAYSTSESLLATGGSTCAGGTLNRTAYWMPSIIDTKTGQPMLPSSTNFYYKLGYLGVKAGTVQMFPKGLHMIAGDAGNTKPVASLSRFACQTGDKKWHSEIPACAAGGDFVVSVTFPQCWDGKNLDSPDHKSHMAYGIPGKGCPADHPVPLPEVSQNVHYRVPQESSTSDWRLSSDMYIGPGGYSLHSDWMGAWDDTTMKTFIDNCINAKRDCHDNLLGDDTVLY